MKKRIYYAIAAIIFLFGLALALDFGMSKDDHLETYVKRIERSLHKKESEVHTLMADTGFIFRQLRGVDRLQPPQQEKDLERLYRLTSKEYNLNVYDGDSLVFWLNNRAFLSAEQLAELKLGAGLTKLVRLPNGYFELIKKDLPGGLIATALLPIKKEFSRKSDFLKSSFLTEDFSIPDDVFLKPEVGDFLISSMDGHPLASLDATGPAKDRMHLKLIFFIYILGFIALGVLVNDLAVILVQRFKPWAGAAFVLGAVIGIRWLTVELGFTKHFAEFQTFSDVFTDPILEGVDSLGELLINIVLLVWMMVFFNREFLVKEFEHPSKTIRFSLTTLNFFAINLGMLMVCSIFKSIVLDSSIVFDFENVFNLNSQSVLAMIGVVLLLLALFLFSHRMMQAIQRIGMQRKGKLLAMGVALLVTAPVVEMSELQISMPFFLAAATIYLVVFEYFIEIPNMTLGWLVGWLMLYAGLTSMLLYKYNNDKDVNRRKSYAEALANYQDDKVVPPLAQLDERLQDSTSIEAWNQLLRSFEIGEIPKELGKKIVDEKLVDIKYVLHNYQYKLYAFVRSSGQSALSDEEMSRGALEQQFAGGQSTSHPELVFIPEQTRNPGYLLRFNLPTSEPLLFFAKFSRSFSSPSKVYTELLLDTKYKGLNELDEYDYGIYQDGFLVEERNKSYSKQLTDKVPPVEEYRIVKNTSRRSELLYQAPANVVIKIGKDTGGYIKPLSLFSYVFTLLVVAVLLFSGINYWTNALPGPLNFWRTTKPSLRNQFQFWVIGMILFSFLGIGFVSVIFFQDSSNEYHKGRLDRKVTSALASVDYQVDQWHRHRQEELEIRERVASRIERELGTDELAMFNQLEYEKELINTNVYSLSELIPLISEVHRLDVNFYNLDGDLITSSEEDIFKHGLVAPKMGSHAFQELTKLGYERSDQEEDIGDLQYTAAYLPLKNVEGETLAFMGIPYYARQRELHSDVTDFMSTLLNVYVFLLLIAGGLAIFIANNITRALSDLRENLGSMALGGNQQLVYKRKDEIGDLVDAYNRAIKKIEESSKLLAQSERDSAWREMAKQVAHEIKNPLTPMKLSIQYLLHAYQSNPENAEPLLKRVSKTLIEQIDSLANIATEFSNFAKMPKPENSEFSINDLAASVHHLFANERPDMDISLNLPEKDYEVFADRNHLTRVMNNLFKNAIQSIPDDQEGAIDFSIYQKGSKVLMEVKDNGSGISPEIQKKVFTPNFSTKNSGTGLGLAICKSIIEGFGGNIYFETEVGVGTTFFVELPLVKVNELEEA